MKMNNLRWLSAFFVVVIVLILVLGSCSAFWNFGHAPIIKKEFHPHIKQLTLTNSDTKQQLQIKVISKKEGVCKFEEIFEITALGSDYTPKKGRDFGLRFRNKTHSDASDKIKSIEWYIWKDNEWQPLKWDWLGRATPIKENETKLYKLVVTKKHAELGDKRILIIPKFMDIEDERLTWWNVSWHYRINSTLDNVPSGGYTYQLMVHSGSGTNNQTDVYLNGHGASNFKDIRFVLDDTTELDYWIEYNSTDPIRVYIDVPTNGTVYMYYGNPDVETTSDLRSVGVFGDDFRDNTKWTTTHPSDYYISNGYLTCNGVSMENPKIYTNTFPSLTNYSVQFNIKTQNCVGSMIFYGCMQNGIGVPMTDNLNFSGMRRNCDENSVRFCDGYQGTESCYATVGLIECFDIDTDPYWGLKFFVYNGSGTIQKWNENFTSMIESQSASGFRLSSFNRFVFSQFTSTDSMNRIDNILIRKYQYPEPEWQTWSTEETETTFTGESITQYNSQRKLVRTSDNYLHRVYTKYDGSNYRVYYAKSTDGGSTWAESVLTDAGVNNTHPSIATDSEDNLWVVYEKYNEGIKYKKYNGLSWENEQDISSDSGHVPAIAVDSNDNIHVVWHTGTGKICYRTYNGTAWSSIQNLRESNYPQYPSIAIDTNNYIHVVWQELNMTTNTYNIKHRMYTSSWQPIHNITTGETYNQEYPCIATDTSGNAWIVWQTQDHKIKAIKYKSDGTWSSIETVCDGSIYEQRNPSVSIYSNNYVRVVWYGQDSAHHDNYIIRERHRTSSWSSITDILYPTGKDVVYPSLISALYPCLCTNCYINIPDEGYAFVYDENGEIKYYASDDLAWRCSTKYTLTLKAIDAKTGMAVTSFSADLGTGETKSTTNGIVKFRCLETGYYSLRITANGYYVHTETVVVDSTKEMTVSLTPISESEYYLLPKAKTVTFTVQNIYGNRIPNLYVEAVGYNITHPYGWLGTIFGFTNATEIYNTIQNGTTDSYGQIAFTMVETIKYKVNFRNDTLGINKTWFKYPTRSEYTIVILPWEYSPEEKRKQEIMATTVNITTSKINETHAIIYVNYTDPSGLTTYLNINITRIAVLNKKEVVYNYTVTNQSIVNQSFIVTPYKGRSFGIRVTAIHEDFGERIWEYGVKFKGLLTDLKLPEKAYPLMAIALIFFIGGLFGATTALQGSLIVCIVSWIFYGIGWLNLAPNKVMISALSLATVISVLALLMEKARKVGVQ